MPRTSCLVSLVVVGLLVGACSSVSVPEPTRTPEPTASPEPSVQATATRIPPTPTPTVDVPTPEPTVAAGPISVDITLADNIIRASQTTYQAGVPYVFVIKNTGRREHSFSISAPVSVAGSISAAWDTALLAIDETQLPPGGGATVEFTFPAEAVGAVLEFNCLIRRHYEDGMFLGITVTG